MANMLKTFLRRLTEAVAPSRAPSPAPQPTAQRAPQSTTRPPGQPQPKHVPTHERGRQIEYSPNLDGDADPGEIVWTWVPYEDDPAQGKDRPVLVVGRSGRTVLGLMLSSKDRRDGEHNWLSIGTGAWDREDRPSWIRLDRIIEVDHDGIRREGAILDRARFDEVAARLRKEYGWR